MQSIQIGYVVLSLFSRHLEGLDTVFASVPLDRDQSNQGVGKVPRLIQASL